MTDDLAARLLQAHVDFTKRQLRDTEFYDLIVDEVDHALEEATQLTLGECVTPQQIKDVAHKWAVQVPLEGAIAEISGEIAGRLYRHPANDTTSLADLVDTRRFDELLTTVLEMEVTQRVLRQLWESPVTTDMVTTVLHSAATSAADDAARALDRNRLTRMIAGAGARTLGRSVPTISERADQVTRRAVHAVLRRATVDGDQSLADEVRNVWRRNRDNSLASLREVLSGDDLDDAVVLVFEFWRTFRHTAYFRAMLDEGIDHVFDKYGSGSLHELLTEVGVGRDDMIEEAMRFAPPVIATLDERGLLDTIVRRRLAPFYESVEFLAAVENPL